MKLPKLKLPNWVGNLEIKKTEFDKLYKKHTLDPVLKDAAGRNYNGSQNANEFFAMWGILSQYIILRKLKKVRFLEIGAYKGLWALMLSHICDKLKVDYEYTTITKLSQDSTNNLTGPMVYYYNKNKHFKVIDKYSQDPSVVNDLDKEYDFVFIDGGHSYDEAFSDFMVFPNFCKSILFWHDLSSEDVQKAYKNAGVFMHEQFLVDSRYCGIGINYIDEDFFDNFRWNKTPNELRFSY